MAQPNTPMLISKKSQEALIQYHNQCYILQQSHWNIREQMRKIDLAYMREADFTDIHAQSKLANKRGDSTKIQNVTVPVIMPAVESAVTYQSSVFLTGNPIFGIVSTPQNMDAAMQMETVIDDQSTRGGWVRELMLFFRDGFKYNLGALEVCWDRTVTAALETDLGFSTKQARPREVIWEGNVIRRRNPYNLIFDMRVPPAEVYWRGEFAGYKELMSRIELKDFINRLPEKLVDNIIPAFESSIGMGGVTTSNANLGYYIPQLNPDALLDRDPRATTNWLAWAGLSGSDSKIQYKDMYEITTLYAKILPSDFNMRVPSPNTPQIWKFVIVNNAVLLYAERQTNAHGYLPMFFCQPLEDGLDYQTKSLASNVAPIQDITTALWNSTLAARRRAIGDRGIYDPSRISDVHINNPNPAAKIPVRPSAYGKNVQEAYYPIPFRDDQSGIVMQETKDLIQMGNVITGQNPVRQGQFVKGNKTLREFESVMSNANGRDQLIAMSLEAQIFTPVKEVLKVNILQYQGGVSLFNKAAQKEVTIDPIALRKAVMDFKVSDGLIPSEKIISDDALTVGFQTLQSVPQLGAGYNLTPMFSYLMKVKGADLRPFEKSPEQIAYEQAMQQWTMAAQMVAEGLKKMEDPAAAQKFIKENLPPQPQPQQFGYNPQGQGAAAAAPPTEVATRVNNITNVIQNKEQ